MLLVTIFIGVDCFVKTNCSTEQIYRIISNETASLLIQFMMLCIPIAWSVIAVTAIFKEKPFGVEVSTHLPMLAKGYVFNFKPKFLMIILGIISVTSIIMYLLHFRFTLALLSFLSMIFTIFMIGYLHTYLFSYEKLVKKIKTLIKEAYDIYPAYHEEFDTYDFISKLFDYGASLKKEEYVKMVDFFDIAFSIYEQSIIKYQEHNEIEVPAIGEMDEKKRTALVDNANNTLFLPSYLIDNICYFLFLLMQKDDRRHFFKLTYFIRSMNHIVRATGEETVFDDMDDYPTIDYPYYVIYEDHFVRKEFLDNIARTYRRKITDERKQNILQSWISGIKEMFLDFTNSLYEKEISELLVYLRKQAEKFRADNDTP